MLTLYRSYTSLIHSLVAGRDETSVLYDKDVRFFFGCASILVVDPDLAMAENFSHYAEGKERGEVESYVRLFAHAYNTNHCGLADRTRFAKDANGRHHESDKDVVESLLGWPPGTIVALCTPENLALDEFERNMTWQDAVYKYPCFANLCGRAERAGIQPVVKMVWRSW